MIVDHLSLEDTIPRYFFFLYKSVEYNKKAEERNPKYTGSIQRGARGRKEEREKISKTNHPRGKPTRSPSEKGKKKKNGGAPH